MEYIISGMVSMLRSGDAKPEMSIEDLQSICPEPELQEYDDLAELEGLWEQAKAAFAASRQ